MPLYAGTFLGRIVVTLLLLQKRYNIKSKAWECYDILYDVYDILHTSSRAPISSIEAAHFAPYLYPIAAPSKSSHRP